ncbi:MAG: murein transglycosylase A [Candidatus Accumulibacter sp. UW20]|jgi:membrane-bound lytic murein transglycosylase A
MLKSQSRSLLALTIPLFALLVAACGSTGKDSISVPSGCPACAACPACPATGRATPPTARPLQVARWSDLPDWQDDDLVAAWPAFLQSCRALAKRPQWPQWQAVCDEARNFPAATTRELRRFFESRFQPWLLSNDDGTTRGLVTGYYEPLLRGSRTRNKPYLQPVLGVPPDLLTIELGAVLPDLKNMRLRGRLQGNKIVPYFSRAEITAREKAHPERALLYVDDAVELFFLQVQGSGRVRLPDGSTVRLAYANQNGHPYQSIGRVLVDRGEMTLDQASMASIKEWARAHPERLDELLNANPSYVFFREEAARANADEGPNGALGVPLSAGRSIAVDPRHVPLGAPVFLATSQPDSTVPLRRLVLAQDTGGAIHGGVRADLFWGFGSAAGSQAGRMKQQGQMWVLLPPSAAPK